MPKAAAPAGKGPGADAQVRKPDRACPPGRRRCARCLPNPPGKVRVAKNRMLRSREARLHRLCPAAPQTSPRQNSTARKSRATANRLKAMELAIPATIARRRALRSTPFR